MANIRRGISLVVLVLPGLANVAVADEYHYTNLLIGDRASGMGGAYTAISDDATGMFYNPAAIVYVGDKNFSASVNAYQTQSKKYENTIGNQPFERKSSALLANYFGIVKPLGRFKLGFSYAVPDAVGEDQHQTFTNVDASLLRYSINLQKKDNTYNFGPSIAAELDNNLAIGLTLYAHQRKVQLVQNELREFTSNLSRWTNRYYEVSETGMRPILGVSWAPVEKLSLGFSLSRTFTFSSSGYDQKICSDATAGNCVATAAVPSVQTPTVTNFSVKRKYPYRMAAGAAYYVDSNLIVSGDVTYHTAVTDPYGDKVATVNAALGTEYYLSKKWAVRAGLYTDVANTPGIQTGAYTAEEKINLYGASMSLTNFSGGSSVTLGGSLSYGKGQSQIKGDTSVQNASTLGWLFFLSSSY